ncbi:MAG TPA: DinB family protein [Gemmatimonadaceae bacterium]|nr:DinB family protein [Gemmatimonadaceae bacterium]
MSRAILRAVLLRELRAVRREVEAYPDDASLWAQRPGLPNAGGTIALHLAGNLQHYVGHRLGGTGYVRDRDAEFARRDVPRAEVLAELDAAAAAIDAALADSAGTGATLPVRYPEAVGGRTLTTDDMLVHLAVHLAYHLGQLDYHRRLVTGDGRGVDAVAIRELPAAG